MPDSNEQNQIASSALQKCCAYASSLLTIQMPAVKAATLDLNPAFTQMMIDLYLIGAMWKFNEQFDLPTSPRDRAFIGLMNFLMNNGKHEDAAQKRIAYLNQHSNTEGSYGQLAIQAGYEFADRQGGLAILLGQFKDNPEASAAPWRMLSRAKPIAVILMVASATLALLFGRSIGEALGVGIVFGLTTLGIALVIHKQMIKPKQ